MLVLMNLSIVFSTFVCRYPKGRVDCFVSGVYADTNRCANWYEACANPSIFFDASGIQRVNKEISHAQ
jgi:hypothetical protein